MTTRWGESLLDHVVGPSVLTRVLKWGGGKKKDSDGLALNTKGAGSQGKRGRL